MSNQQEVEVAAQVLRGTVAMYIDVAQRYAAGDPAVTRRQVLGCRGVVALAMEELTGRIEKLTEQRLAEDSE